MIPTPAYIINEGKLRANLALLKSVEKEAGIKILIALKAFSFWPAFNIIGEYFKDGAASSYHEARLIHEELGGQAHTFSTVFYEQDFDQICDISEHLIFNSVNQLIKFKTRALKKGRSIGLRVNPQWSDVETELYNPAAPHSRLGVTADTLGDFWDADIDGLHFHVLCESNSYSLETALQHFENRFGEVLKKVKWVNFGGGHLIPSQGYDIDHLIQLLQAFREKHNVDIYLEPGAAFVWQTGILKSKVMDIVQNGDTKIANLDISFTCHMPDTLEMPYKPKVLSEVESSSHEYYLGGTSCLAGDFIGTFFFAQPLKENDIIEFDDMIHYTLVKTTFFNGVKHPSVYLEKLDGQSVLLREYGYNDFKSKC